MTKNKVYDFDICELCIDDLQEMFDVANINRNYIDDLVCNIDVQEEVCMVIQPTDFINAIKQTTNAMPDNHPCKKIFNNYVKSSESEDGDDFEAFLKQFQNYLNQNN